MTVLAIIGGLIVLYLLYLLVEFINQHSQKAYNYTFFDIGTLAIVSISYYFLYFGYQLWQDVLKSESGDPLNGIILMVIGGIILVLFIVSQISKTSIFVGVPITIFQLLLYIPISFFIIIDLLILFAAMAESKPVYVINDD